MTKSTFDQEQKKSNLKHEAFPTFRAIPALLLKFTCTSPKCFLKMLQWLGNIWKKSWQVLLALIVIIAIFYVALDIYATAQLNHQLNLIRQKGEPLIFAEAAPPKIPDSENAAILYQRADQTYTSIRNRLRKKGGLSDNQITAQIEQNKTIQNLIREATTKQDCRFNLDWSSSAMQILPDQQMRRWARLLATEADTEANSGDITAALQDTKRIYIMANHVSQQPVFISTLIARDIESLANDALAKVLLHGSLSASQAHKYNASVPVINWQTVFHRSLITERASLIEIFRSSSQMLDVVASSESFPKSTRFLWRTLSPLQKMDETYSLKAWQELLDDASKSTSSFFTTSNPKDNVGIDQMPWYALISKMMLQLFSSPRRFYNRSEVQRRQREIALALAAYHTQHHKYPTTLSPAENSGKVLFPLILTATTIPLQKQW